MISNSLKRQVQKISATSIRRSQSQPISTPRDFNAIPKITLWHFLRCTMPGIGKYRNLEYSQMMSELAKENGPVFRMSRLDGEPLVVTHNPADFEQIFRNEGQWPERVGLETMHYHRSVHRKDFFQGIEGLLPTNGKEWGSFRSAVNPVLMQPKNVQLFVQRMSDVNKKFLERILAIRDPISQEVPANFEDEINRFTLETISTIALDKQLGLFESSSSDSNNPKTIKANRLHENLKEFFHLSLELNLKPSLWKYYATPDFKRLMKVLDEMLEITHGFVQETVERLENESKSGLPSRAEHELSVLEKLLKIDRQTAVVMAMDMIFAGVDSSSSVFAGILLSLAKFPAKQAKLRSEVLQILPKKDSEFTASSLQSAPYLRAVLKEAMRLYPFSLFNIRVSQKPLILSDYQIPAGTTVLMAFSDILRNEQYFPKAAEFLPERWLRSGGSADANAAEIFVPKPSSPFLHIPFGFGARTCIGKRLVEMELSLCVARLIRNFHVEFDYPAERVFKCNLVSQPNKPLKFKFTDVKD